MTYKLYNRITLGADTQTFFNMEIYGMKTTLFMEIITYSNTFSPSLLFNACLTHVVVIIFILSLFYSLNKGTRRLWVVILLL